MKRHITRFSLGAGIAFVAVTTAALSRLTWAQSCSGGCPQSCNNGSSCAYGVQWTNADCCTYPSCCPDGMTLTGSCCCSATPILINLGKSGIELTSVNDGVEFDIAARGTKVKVAWTVPQTEDGFLALDRNHDGFINDGSELFGNMTSQPLPVTGGKNGFLALAEFDKPANGGNADGLIDAVRVNFFL